MILGFDLDGVLYSWHEVVARDLKHMGVLKQNETLYDIFHPDNRRFDKLTKKFVREVLYNTEYYKEEPMHKYKHKLLWDLINDGHEIVYVSSRPVRKAKKPTLEWLYSNDAPNPEQLFLVKGAKKPVVESLGCDIFIDDKIQHAKELRKVTEVFLLNRPWNEGVRLPRGVRRLNHLTELRDIVKERENG